MAPNSLYNFLASSSTTSFVTLLIYVMELMLILTFALETKSSSPPVTGRTPNSHDLTSPFSPSDFDFDWEQSSLDNLRMWRWRNRNRERYEKFGMRKFPRRRPSDDIWYDSRSKLRAGDKQVHRVGEKRRKEIPEKQIERFKKRDPFLVKVDFEDSCCPTVKELISPSLGRNSTGHVVELYQDDTINQKFYEISCRRDVKNQPCKFLENRHSKKSKCTQQHTLTYALVRPHKNSSLAKPYVSAEREDKYPVLSKRSRAQDLLFQKQHRENIMGHYNNNRNENEKQQAQSHGYINNMLAVMMSNGAVLRQPWYLDYITIRSGCACHIEKVNNDRRRKKASQ